LNLPHGGIKHILKNVADTGIIAVNNLIGVSE